MSASFFLWFVIFSRLCDAWVMSSVYEITWVTQHVVAAFSHCFRQNPINVNFAACGMFSLYPPDGMTVCSIRFRAFQVKSVAMCILICLTNIKSNVLLITYHYLYYLLLITYYLWQFSAFVFEFGMCIASIHVWHILNLAYYLLLNSDTNNV